LKQSTCSEIRDERVWSRYEHIPRLDIAMDNARGVSVSKSVCDLTPEAK